MQLPESALLWRGIHRPCILSPARPSGHLFRPSLPVAATPFRGRDPHVGRFRRFGTPGAARNAILTPPEAAREAG